MVKHVIEDNKDLTIIVRADVENGVFNLDVKMSAKQLLDYRSKDINPYVMVNNRMLINDRGEFLSHIELK